MKNNNVIRIHKQVTRKDAFRASNAESIPTFLRETVTFDGNEFTLICVEGTERGPVGSVIGYEESNQTATGYNCWFIGEDSITEIDGVFYTKATILEAEAVSDEFPEFLRGAEIRHNEDGSWTIKTSWGESTGFPGKAYWVLYKRDGDKVDANILTKSEKSYRNFIVCDADGKDIGFLYEIDPA